MTTITQRKKLSKGTWALIFVLIAALITVIVLAAVGIVDLTFLSDWLVGVMMFGSLGWINAVITLALPFIGGIVVCYVAYRYFIGQKVTTNMPTTGYSPAPTYPTAQPASKDSETVIS